MKKLFVALFALFTLAAAFAQQVATPFTPLKNGTPLTVTASAQAYTLPTSPLVAQRIMLQYVIVAQGTQTVYYACDGTVPTTSGATVGMPILANWPILISLPASVTTCQFIANSTGSTINVTLGLGGQ